MYVKCPAANISHVTQKGFGLKPVMVWVNWGGVGGGAVTSEGSAHRDTETGRAHRLCDWNFYARRGDLTLFNLLTYLTHRHMHAHTLAVAGEQLQIKHIRSNREGRVR